MNTLAPTTLKEMMRNDIAKLKDDKRNMMKNDIAKLGDYNRNMMKNDTKLGDYNKMIDDNAELEDYNRMKNCRTNQKNSVQLIYKSCSQKY